MKVIDAKKYYYFSDNYFSGINKKLKKKSYIINIFDKKNCSEFYDSFYR